MATIKVKRGTRSAINTAASASGLNQGELYLITDEDVLAVGTAAGSYTDVNSSAETNNNFRNRIINGGMKISQRGTSFSFAHDGTSNGYHLDRFKIFLHNTDEYDCTVSQYSMTAAEINTTGHTKALKLLTGTAESAIANDEYARITYRPEAKDIQDFLHGTASAKTITLSFWVKSSVAGTFGFNLYRYVSSGTARIINLSYTIDVANTWEHKTIQIPGDTGGNLAPNDTTAGFILIWQLASGSDRYSTAATSWGDYATTRLMGNHSDAVITTASADWYLTGVQLEIGTVATPFEHRPISVELSLAQRYYEKSFNLSTAPANNTAETTVIYSHMQSGYGYAVPIIFKERKRAAGASTIVYNPFATTANRAAWVASSNQAFTHSNVYSITEIGFYVLNYSSPVATPDSTGNIIAFNWSAESEL